MSNTISEGDILICYEWSCPLCGYWNSGSDVHDAEPKEGNTLYCGECGKACKIIK